MIRAFQEWLFSLRPVNFWVFGRGPVLHWDQNEFAFAQTASSGPAEANTHARAGPDGQPASTEPAGAERDDLG